MSGKFRKRDIERKGTDKEHGKDMKMLDENAIDLAHPERLSKDYEKETAPEDAEATSRERKREGV